MIIIKYQKENQREIINECVRVLQGGGIVVHSTDTCYGLAADISNPTAYKKVYDFKQRDYKKPVNMIVYDRKQFEEFGEWQKDIDEYINDETRQYSFVVKKTRKVPAFFNPQEEYLGIQIPKHDFSLSLLGSFQKPLVATSANISGEGVVYGVSDLLVQIAKSRVLPDLIIDNGILKKNRPSRVIKFHANGKIERLRD